MCGGTAGKVLYGKAGIAKRYGGLLWHIAKVPYALNALPKPGLVTSASLKTGIPKYPDT